ncbi:MAG TPA: hypothetical protein DCE71_08760 [Parachlamydiales bacterium]|nr:hypothetical protein [Parachlamydiales bacterium]
MGGYEREDDCVIDLIKLKKFREVLKRLEKASTLKEPFIRNYEESDDQFEIRCLVASYFPELSYLSIMGSHG